MRQFFVLLTLFSVACWHHSCFASSPGARHDTNDHCIGYSPKGIRWAYLMPQHTGTTVISDALTDVIAKDMERTDRTNTTSHHVQFCPHIHKALYAKDQKHFNITFTFMFVAHPYKRLLSSIIHSGEKLKILNNSVDQQILNFRKYLSVVCNSSSHQPLISKSSHQRFHKNGSLTKYSLHGHGGCNVFSRPMSTYFRPSQRPSFLGRVTHLQEDFNTVLHLLGYPPHEIHGQHCISSCNVVATRPNVSYLEYFSTENKRCVDQCYRDDLNIYNSLLGKVPSMS